MTQFQSDFLRTLQMRGFIHQTTDPKALDDLCAKGPIVAYIGFDATAQSLHVGSLVQIMMLRHLQKAGHKPIVLIGGGTTKVGDPSGKDESRQLLTDDQIKANADKLKCVFAQFLDFNDSPNGAVMVNNADWLDQLNYIEFLRDYGRHFSVNRMLSFDSVKLRLEREQNLSFLEFNYMIFQAYDFVELKKRHNCILQLGGSDQWGNIVNGIELGRRTDQVDLFGLTSPLITTASGAKMGKTAAGAVWLNADWLSPYDYWQFWRNTEDADVGRFLRMFTELPIPEIEKLESLLDAQINEAKKILATEATALCHGREEAEKAAQTAISLFEQHTLSDNLPQFQLPATGLGLIDLLVSAELVASRGEAKRLIEGKGVKLNDEPLSDMNTHIQLGANEEAKLSLGKKRHILLKLASHA